MASASRRRTVVLLVAVVLALAVRLLSILAFRPASDVYFFDAEAARILLLGQNPYTHAFVGAPSYLGTPGGTGGFAYLPLTAIYLVPFLLIGDVRLGFVFADLVIGVAIARFSGRVALLSGVVYLLVPFTVLFSTVYPNDSLVAMWLIALAVLLWAGERRILSAVSFGLALASIQLAWLVLPFVFLLYLRDRRPAYILPCLAVAAAVIAPFFLASPARFLDETVFFQFSRPILPLVGTNGQLGLNLNPSLAGIAASLGFSVPPLLKAVVDGALLVSCLAWARRTGSVLLPAGVFVMASVLVLPNDFFWAYAELPFMLVLMWLSRRGSRVVKES